MISTTKGYILSAALGLAVLTAPTVGHAAPAVDTSFSTAPETTVEQVQYYGGGYYGYRPGGYYGYRPRPYYGYQPESYDHYVYRQAHRAYRAERYYRYGY